MLLLLMRLKILLSIFFLFLVTVLTGQNTSKTENIILITFDGLRWKEVFQGADEDIIRNKKYVKDIRNTEEIYWDSDPFIRRMKLFPFIWSTVVSEGQIYGNRLLGNKVNVINRYRFSYPGYNELLTGIPDKRIKSNAKLNNPNKTILEFVNQQAGYQNKVAAFASWDVFQYIINQKRSGIHINAGNDTAKTRLTAREKYLNHLQQNTPSPWGGTRFDEFTHQYAKEYLKKIKPRFVLIAYGETDEFAHNGRYDSYLRAANKTDAYIKDIWEWVQSEPQYRNKTTLIITTDHGRGTGRNSWKSHGAGWTGSNYTWFMVLGPDTSPLGEINEKKHYYSNQLAKTIAALLNISYPENKSQGAVVATAFNH